ncbi:MAG: hypothetical protein M3460_20000 [Actinomycetota bacterium]|nr:hypothetical protein [Actinomycetota bacterium]
MRRTSRPVLGVPVPGPAVGDAGGNVVTPHAGRPATELHGAPGGMPHPTPQQPAAHYPDHQPERTVRRHLQPGGSPAQHHLVVAVTHPVQWPHHAEPHQHATRVVMH